MTRPGTNKSKLAAPLQEKKHKITWAVDQISVASGMLSASGWCATPVFQERLSATLLVNLGPQTLRLPLTLDQQRPDVSSANPLFDSQCGFFIYTQLPEARLPDTIALELSLEQEGSPEAHEIYRNPNLLPQKHSPQLRLLLHYTKKALKMLVAGQWKIVFKRVSSSLPLLFTRTAKPEELQKQLATLPADSLLVIDHSLGGGANHYRDELIAFHSARGRYTLLWTFSPATLSYQVIFYPPGAPSFQLKTDVTAWNILADSGKIQEVVFNNCVSFPQPENIPELLSDFARQDSRRKLTVLIHDFYSVCPSHFLIDYQGKHCQLPDRTQCRQCLPKIEDPLVKLYTSLDIDVWRSRWLSLLESATEVICFSENTSNLLRRTYPALPPECIQVIPHKVDYLTGNYSMPNRQSRMHVAVVGQIGKHKGGERFLDLVSAAETENADLDFFVIGALAGLAKPAGVIETGPYHRDELAELLKRHQIQLVLMLSIWPETFSYVTHELIKLGVPLMSYDIGAHGDAIRAYPLGRTVPLNVDGQTLLAEIQSFRAVLQNQPSHY